MTEKEKQILQTIERTIPAMSDLEKEKFLSFSEGIAFMIEQQKRNKSESEQKGA